MEDAKTSRKRVFKHRTIKRKVDDIMRKRCRFLLRISNHSTTVGIQPTTSQGCTASGLANNFIENQMHDGGEKTTERQRILEVEEDEENEESMNEVSGDEENEESMNEVSGDGENEVSINEVTEDHIDEFDKINPRSGPARGVEFDTEALDETNQLIRWAMRHNVTHKALDELMDIAETSAVSENTPVVEKTGEKSGCIDQEIGKHSAELTTLAAYDMTQMCMDIQHIKYEQGVLIATVNKLQKWLEQVLPTDGAIVQNSFEMKFQLTFPVASYEKFDEFDELLSTNETCRTAFVQQLCQKYDEKRSISKNLTTILRKYLTRDVAMQFNAQKKAQNKILLKDTTFFECLTAMFDLLVENKRILPSPDKEYLLHLGTVLSNSKDWGMSRRPRKGTHNFSQK